MPIDVYDFCGGDMLSMFDSSVVTARKAHKCTDCRTMIGPGERYRRSSGLQDGCGWESFKTCSPCDSLMQDVFDGGWVFGCLSEVLGEEARERGTDVEFQKAVKAFYERRSASRV